MGREVRMNSHELRLFSLMAVAIIVMALALLLLVLVPGAMGGGIVGDQPPASGEWVIENDTVVTDTTVTVNGPVTINAKLTLLSSTLRVSVATAGIGGVEVRTGALFANDSTIESGNGNVYEFLASSEMNLTRVTVRDVHDGIRVRTNDDVVLDDVLITDLDGPALWLERSSKAVVRDLRVYDTTYDRTFYRRLTTGTVTGNLDWDEIIPAVIIIQGGGPLLDGVDISLNGTVYYDVDFHQQTPTGGLTFDVEWPILDVDTVDPIEIRDITCRDSTIGLNVTVRCAEMAAQYTEVDIAWGTVGVAFRNYRDASLSGFTFANFRHHETYFNVTTASPSTQLGYSRLDWASRAVFAYVDEIFDRRGPHSFDLEIEDMSLGDAAALYHVLEPGYSGTSSPTFNSRVVLDNVTTRLAYRPVRFLLRPQFDIFKTFNVDNRISNCTFQTLNSPCIEFEYMTGPVIPRTRSITLNEVTVIENCAFYRCISKDVGMIRARSYLSYPHVFNSTLKVTKCNFSANSGTLLNVSGASGLKEDRLVFDRNLVSGSGCARTDLFMQIMQKTVVVITNNTFINNRCSNGIYLADNGGYFTDPSGTGAVKQPTTFIIANNTFDGNVVDWKGDSTRGLFDVTWGGELVVSGNWINDTGSRFMNVTEYPFFARRCTLDFQDNLVEWNRRTILYFKVADKDHERLEAWIRNNTVWDNTGPLVDYALSSLVEQYDYDAWFHLLDNDVRRAGSTVFSNYGNISVSGNTFIDCVGWVLELDYLNKQQPTLNNNTFVRCGDAIYVRAKMNAPIQVLLWMDNNQIDTNGTGIYFRYMEVVLRTTTITSSAGKAVVADISKVDAYDCDFDADACEVVVDGYIKMWYWVEAWVYWASKEGVGTTNPVVGGSVTFFDQYDVESLVVLPDDTGHVVPTEVMAWHIIHSVSPVMKNPYTIAVNFSSFSTSVEVTVDRSFKGEDALTLLLWDPEDPLVSIERPEHMSAHNTLDLEVTGFATDKASGVHRLTVQVDDGVRQNITDIEEDGSYYHLLVEVPEGLHVLTVTVHDAGLNTMVVTITVDVDRTPPRLVVTHPSGELHTNLTQVNIRGEVEPGSNLTVNMYEYAIEGGVFDLAFNLNEGPNYFGITATDRAGNVAIVVVWVYRDTFDPVLAVFSPSDGLDTNATDVRVLGRAEEYDTVTITLHRSFTDIVDRPVYPDEGGQFDVLADLEEGVNEIVVTARDRAGNQVTVRRTVTLDTTPPEMELISPENDALLNVRQVTVVFTVSEDADQVYVNGKRVLGTGELDTVVMLGEGENPITLRAFDLLYNEVTIDLIVLVDTVPPVLQVTEPANASFKTNDPFIEVRGWASDGDLNGITVHVEGGPATITTDGKFYYLLELDEDGTHVIEVVARDRAGNIARDTFTVDLRTEAPLMTLVFDPPDERVDPGTILLIQGAATGIPLTVTIVHDAAGDRREFTFMLINVSFEHYLDLVDGVNTITVRSEDAYGNWNVTAPHVVNVKEKDVQETPGNDTWYLIAAVLVAVALIVVAYVVLKRP